LIVKCDGVLPKLTNATAAFKWPLAALRWPAQSVLPCLCLHEIENKEQKQAICYRRDPDTFKIGAECVESRVELAVMQRKPR